MNECGKYLTKNPTKHADELNNANSSDMYKDLYNTFLYIEAVYIFFTNINFFSEIW